ncbi:hypothetical protein MASR1M74_28950 [Lentimicrobium sp.]
MPGLNTKTVEDLVAEIGLDMSVFPSEKHLASWAAMAPGNNESAGKKSGRITHGNKQVKATITEAAWAATRTKTHFIRQGIIDWQHDEAKESLNSHRTFDPEVCLSQPQR